MVRIPDGKVLSVYRAEMFAFYFYNIFIAGLSDFDFIVKDPVIRAACKLHGKRNARGKSEIIFQRKISLQLYEGISSFSLIIKSFFKFFPRRLSGIHETVVIILIRKLIVFPALQMFRKGSSYRKKHGHIFFCSADRRNWLYQFCSFNLLISYQIITDLQTLRVYAKLAIAVFK